MKPRGFFVVGTDTGVGKTTVSVGLLTALARRGHRMAAMKPCETGEGDDAARLLRATGRALDPAIVNPYRFPLPAAPEVAARASGQVIELDRIEQCYRALASDAELTLVEGAGGLLVPFAPKSTTVEVIARLELPVLVIARTRLGTINHTLLTTTVLRARGLRLLGVVFSRSTPEVGPEEGETLATIEQHGALRALGILPWLDERTLHDPNALADQVEQNLVLDELVGMI